MNIKELNEAFDKVLNEISDETKEKVLNLRKEQAKRAQDKLHKSLTLAAKANIGKPQSIEINFFTGVVDVYEDDYTEGEGKYVQTWDNGTRQSYTIRMDDTFTKQLADIAGKYMDCYWITGQSLAIRLEREDIFLEFGDECTEDLSKPSSEDIKQWKSGEKQLYAIYGRIKIELSDNDKPYFLKACEDAKLDVYEI